MSNFDEIRKRADGIVSMHGRRNSRIKELDEMYLLEWETKVPEGMKITKAPDGRNAVRGIVNLMTAAEPDWSVPAVENNDEANDYNEEMERAARAMWAASNAMQQTALERDLVQSLSLYDEAYIMITNTQDLLNAAKGKGSAWVNVAIEQVAMEAPYLYSIVPPADAYPMMGRAGLMAFVQKSDMQVSEILERFGGLAAEVTKGKKPDEVITIYDYWDAVDHAIWTSGKELLCAPHKLGFIPVVAALGSGTRLYRKPEQQRQPMLYTMKESGVWERKNTILTAMFNRLAALGLGATFVHKKGTPDAELNLDLSIFGGVVEVDPGGDFRLMTDNPVDPNILNALNIVNTLIEDSSVYRQAFGAPVQGTDTFATVSLLAQAGRLPLVPIQRSAEDALARVMQITFKWIKNDDETRTIYNLRDELELEPSRIPDRVIFKTIIDVNLPQDMLRNANIAQMLKEARLVDDRWIHENVLKIGQTIDMKKKIVAQEVADMLVARTIQQALQPPQQPQPGQMPPGQMPPQGPPGPGGTGFDPAMGGLPPAMAGQMPMNEKPGGMPGELGGPETIGGIGGYQ